MNFLKGKHLGCIGFGNMGYAIFQGLIKEKAPCSLYAFDASEQRQSLIKELGHVTNCSSIEEIADKCDILILAVKPDIIHTVLKELATKKDILLISIAAGVSLESIAQSVPENPVIRVMPNTPSLVGSGISVLSPDNKVKEDDISTTQELFSTIGKSITLPEKYMDAVTGLSGSGPAYVFTFIQALADGGVKMGLPRTHALELAAQTVYGAAKMVIENNEDPISLRGSVTSPGGTTIEAVHVLDRSGFSGIVMDAVEAATLKSIELRKK